MHPGQTVRNCWSTWWECIERTGKSFYKLAQVSSRTKAKELWWCQLLEKKLDMRILLGCGIIPSFSAYSFIRLPIWSLLTKVFLNMAERWKRSRAGVQALQYYIGHNQRVAHRWFVARVVLRWEDVCGGNLLEENFWLVHRFFRVSTTHTPTFQHFRNPFVVCNLYASHLAVASSLLSQCRNLLERDVLLDRGRSDSNTALFRRQC